MSFLYSSVTYFLPSFYSLCTSASSSLNFVPLKLWTVVRLPIRQMAQLCERKSCQLCKCGETTHSHGNAVRMTWSITSRLLPQIRTVSHDCLTPLTLTSSLCRQWHICESLWTSWWPSCWEFCSSGKGTKAPVCLTITTCCSRAWCTIWWLRWWSPSSHVSIMWQNEHQAWPKATHTEVI